MSDKDLISNDCPTRSLLMNLIRGKLSEDEERFVSQHISDCDRCQSKLDTSIPDELIAEAKNALSSPEPIATALSVILSEAESDIAESAMLQTISAGGRTQGSTSATPATWADLQPWLTETEDDSLGKLGPYHLKEILGRGGMGIVFRSRDPKLDRPVAIKVLSPGLLADATARERFLHEARAVAAINHPRIVGIYEVVSDTELPYFAMEYVNGQSLESLLASRRKFSANEVTKIGFGIANALSAAHAAGLIHRDIKPANILVESSTGRVRLMDFGLARNNACSNLTVSGALLGTPSYMAPETIAEKPPDERTDLFSLGGVIYHLLTGRLPFEANTVIGTIQAISKGTYVPVKQLAPGTPEGLIKIVDRLLCINPDDRFRSAADVATAFKASRKGASDELEARRFERNSTRTTIGVASFIIVALISVITWDLMNPSSGPGEIPSVPGTGIKHLGQNPQESPQHPENPAEVHGGFNEDGVSGRTVSNDAASQPDGAVVPRTSTPEQPPANDSKLPFSRSSSGIACFNSAGEILDKPESLELAARIVPDGGVIRLPAAQFQVNTSIDFGDKSVQISGPDNGRADIVGDFADSVPMFISARSLALQNLNVTYASKVSDSDDPQIVALEDGRLECTGCRFQIKDGVIVRVNAAEAIRFRDCTLMSPRGSAIQWNTVGCEGELAIESCLILADIAITTTRGLPAVLAVEDSDCVNQIFLFIEQDLEDLETIVCHVWAKTSALLSAETIISIETEGDLEAIEGTLSGFSWQSKESIYSQTILELFEPDEEDPIETLDFENWTRRPSVTETDSRTIRSAEVERLEELIHDLEETKSEPAIKRFLSSIRSRR